MPNPEAFRWFKTTFQSEIAPALVGTPFTVDLLASVAAQETGHIWGRLHKTLPVAEVLKACVGDTIDGTPTKGRQAFPRTKADLVAVPRGQEMFDVAREALKDIAVHDSTMKQIFDANPNKFCHGFGIFQYDIQFFKEDPEYFLQRRWREFGASLRKAIEELKNARNRIPPLRGRPTLTDEEMVHVAIAYNRGSFDPARGLKQGFQENKPVGPFYGEKIDRFLKMAKTVVVVPSGAGTGV